MINYRAIFLVKLWINMFSIRIAVYKQENPYCLPSTWLKNVFNSSHSLPRKDLYVCMGWHLVIKFSLNILIRLKATQSLCSHLENTLSSNRHKAVGQPLSFSQVVNLEQCFSNSCVHKNHLESLLEPGFLSSPSEIPI